MKNQRRLDPKVVKKWVRIIQVIFFVLIGLVIILGIINHFAWAADPGGTAGSPEDLASWVSSLYDTSRLLVAVVAVIMVIAAGIVYALDLGGGKQIGLAKDMIISTISGVILFMLAGWLLNEIGGQQGLFPPVNVPANPSLPIGAGGTPQVPPNVPVGTPPEGVNVPPNTLVPGPGYNLKPTIPPIIAPEP